jgi:hypothetical protein
VAELHLRKRVDRHNPRIEVLLTTLPTEPISLPQGDGSMVAPRARSVSGRKRRRGLRKLRSLEELATRYNWQ